MPLDYSFDSTPGFRDLTHTALVLLQQPLVRSVSRIRRLRRGVHVLPETAVPVKTIRLFRRSPPAGSLS
ncbi:MAG: hypothetical protein ACHQ5A_04255 [Opitutales bacterium]